jgi:hypothetical protein
MGEEKKVKVKRKRGRGRSKLKRNFEKKNKLENLLTIQSDDTK